LISGAKSGAIFSSKACCNHVKSLLLSLEERAENIKKEEVTDDW